MDNPQQLVMGIDPGIAFVGIGIVDLRDRLHHAETVKTIPKVGPYLTRLKVISKVLCEAALKWKPVMIYIEDYTLYGDKSVGQSAVGMGMAIGYFGAALSALGYDEHTLKLVRSTQWRLQVVGRTNASDTEVRAAVQLRTQNDPRIAALSAHAVDAIAIAQFGVSQRRYEKR